MFSRTIALCVVCAVLNYDTKEIGCKGSWQPALILKQFLSVKTENLIFTRQLDRYAKSDFDFWLILLIPLGDYYEYNFHLLCPTCIIETLLLCI